MIDLMTLDELYSVYATLPEPEPEVDEAEYEEWIDLGGEA